MKRPESKLKMWRRSQQPRLSQQQAARRFGISQPQWSRIERGQLHPRGELLKKLVTKTGVSIEILVGIAS